MGSPLTIDGNDLFIENPENIYPELEELVKVYKSRIITYLKGEYTDKEHNVKQTIDKIVDFYREGCRIDSKINDWLQNDVEGLKLVMDLVVEFSRNGWVLSDPVCNFENEKTDEMSIEIYNKAMTYFQKGVGTQ